MIQIQGGFMTDGKRCLYYQAFAQENEVRANIIVVHGLVEHSGRYKNVYDYFGRAGYTLWSFDLLGHGNSPGRRCHVNRFHDFSADLSSFLIKIRREMPDKPVFIIAHSLGSLIALDNLISRPQSPVAGVIVSGLSLQLGAGVSRRLAPFAKLLSAVWPVLRVQKLDATAISRDPAVVTAYLEDERVYSGKVTARLGAELIKTMDMVSARCREIVKPLLILHGSSDRLADPESSRILFSRAGSADKTINLYDGFYHELFNEPGRAQVFSDIDHWLDARLK